jgi:hypothetical protein
MKKPGTSVRLVTRADILPMADYSPKRIELRRELTALRGKRRVEVGPFVTFSFECYRTVWHQIQEMLFIEKGGEEQIPGELSAYNPLIPTGRELVASMMIEIEDPVRRAQMLAKLGHIEDNVVIRVANEVAKAKPEDDEDRTTSEGKTSAVHFLRFPLTAKQIAAFRKPNAEVILAVGHPEYRHLAVLPEATRMALVEDFSA